MRPLSIVSLVLMVIGALNWGLIGLFRFNLVAAIFGTGVLASIVYVIVGLAGIYGIFMLVRLSAQADDVCVPGHMGAYPTTA